MLVPVVTYVALFIRNTYFSETDVYYGLLETNHRCPGYRSILILLEILYNKAPFGTITESVDYVVSSIRINRLHCSSYVVGMYCL